LAIEISGSYVHGVWLWNIAKEEINRAKKNNREQGGKKERKKESGV
jgi:hypothetical protein